jgi:hypothetical protein
MVRIAKAPTHYVSKQNTNRPSAQFRNVLYICAVAHKFGRFARDGRDEAISVTRQEHGGAISRPAAAIFVRIRCDRTAYADDAYNGR